MRAYVAAASQAAVAASLNDSSIQRNLQEVDLCIQKAFSEHEYERSLAENQFENHYKTDTCAYFTLLLQYLYAGFANSGDVHKVRAAVSLVKNRLMSRRDHVSSNRMEANYLEVPDRGPIFCLLDAILVVVTSGNHSVQIQRSFLQLLSTIVRIELTSQEQCHSRVEPNIDNMLQFFTNGLKDGDEEDLQLSINFFDYMLEEYCEYQTNSIHNKIPVILESLVQSLDASSTTDSRKTLSLISVFPSMMGLLDEWCQSREDINTTFFLILWNKVQRAIDVNNMHMDEDSYRDYVEVFCRCLSDLGDLIPDTEKTTEWTLEVGTMYITELYRNMLKAGVDMQASGVLEADPTKGSANVKFYSEAAAYICLEEFERFLGKANERSQGFALGGFVDYVPFLTNLTYANTKLLNTTYDDLQNESAECEAIQSYLNLHETVITVQVVLTQLFQRIKAEEIFKVVDDRLNSPSNVSVLSGLRILASIIRCEGKEISLERQDHFSVGLTRVVCNTKCWYLLDNALFILCLLSKLRGPAFFLENKVLVEFLFTVIQVVSQDQRDPDLLVLAVVTKITFMIERALLADTKGDLTKAYHTSVFKAMLNFLCKHGSEASTDYKRSTVYCMRIIVESGSLKHEGEISNAREQLEGLINQELSNLDKADFISPVTLGDCVGLHTLLSEGMLWNNVVPSCYENWMSQLTSSMELADPGDYEMYVSSIAELAFHYAAFLHKTNATFCIDEWYLINTEKTLRLCIALEQKIDGPISKAVAQLCVPVNRVICKGAEREVSYTIAELEIQLLRSEHFKAQYKPKLMSALSDMFVCDSLSLPVGPVQDFYFACEEGLQLRMEDNASYADQTPAAQEKWVAYLLEVHQISLEGLFAVFWCNSKQFINSMASRAVERVINLALSYMNRTPDPASIMIFEYVIDAISDLQRKFKYPARPAIQNYKSQLSTFAQFLASQDRHHPQKPDLVRCARKLQHVTQRNMGWEF